MIGGILDDVGGGPFLLGDSDLLETSSLFLKSQELGGDLYLGVGVIGDRNFRLVSALDIAMNFGRPVLDGE